MTVVGTTLILTSPAWPAHKDFCPATPQINATSQASGVEATGRRMLRDLLPARGAEQHGADATVTEAGGKNISRDSAASAANSSDSSIASSNNSSPSAGAASGSKKRFTMFSFAMVEAPGGCSMQGASQLGTIVIGVFYNNYVKLLPTAQKICQAKWPGKGYERGWRPTVMAAVSGIIVLVWSIGWSEYAVHQTDTALEISAATAAFFSAQMCATLGDSVEALLALGMGPYCSMVSAMAAVLLIDAGSWVGVAKAWHPWLFWAGRVIALALQLEARSAAATVTATEVKLPDATRLVGNKPIPCLQLLLSYLTAAVLAHCPLLCMPCNACWSITVELQKFM